MTAGPGPAWATDFGDYDGDGRLDLAVTNFEMETHNLYRNLGGGLFADATLPKRHRLPRTLRFLGFGAVFLDYDNDGSLDLAIANGHVLDNTSHFQSASRYAQRKLLLHNDGRGRFTDAGGSAGPGFALEKVEPDARGRRRRQRRRPRSARDQQRPGRQPPAERGRATARNAVLVDLIGRESNRDGVGARIRATVAGRSQIREIKAGSSYLGQNDRRAHFGVGAAREIERLEVRWPSGHRDVLEHLAVNAVLTITEGGDVRRTPFSIRK